MTETEEIVKRSSYKPLWWLIALCAFPYVAGTLYYQYYGMLDRDTSNYGTLVEPVRELSEVSLDLVDGSTKDVEDFRRKWLMLYLLDGACDDTCKQNIYYMRQVRKAMAQDRFRISRLLVVSDPSVYDGELQAFLNEFPGQQVAILNGGNKARFVQLLKADNDEIYRKIMLVDPLGNYMMRYPVELDAKKFLKDVKRLLKVSRIG